MSRLEHRIEALERASGGETVYAIQKRDRNDQPLDVVVLCRGENVEMPLHEFEARYPGGCIVKFIYQDMWEEL